MNKVDCGFSTENQECGIVNNNTKKDIKLVFNSIGMGADRAGFEMKEHIKKHIKTTYPQIKLIDFGTYDEKTLCDYPDFAKLVCKSILKKEVESGILICGTGIGISMAANKFKGIRCALCHDTYSATITRLHNNSNILSFGGRNTGVEIGKEMVDKFFTTGFEGGRHQKRVEKIDLVTEDDKKEEKKEEKDDKKEEKKEEK